MRVGARTPPPWGRWGRAARPPTPASTPSSRSARRRGPRRASPLHWSPERGTSSGVGGKVGSCRPPADAAVDTVVIQGISVFGDGNSKNFQCPPQAQGSARGGGRDTPEFRPAHDPLGVEHAPCGSSSPRANFCLRGRKFEKFPVSSPGSGQRPGRGQGYSIILPFARSARRCADSFRFAIDRTVFHCRCRRISTQRAPSCGAQDSAERGVCNVTYAIWQRIIVTAANTLLCEAAVSQQTI